MLPLECVSHHFVHVSSHSAELCSKRPRLPLYATVKGMLVAWTLHTQKHIVPAVKVLPCRYLFRSRCLSFGTVGCSAATLRAFVRFEQDGLFHIKIRPPVLCFITTAQLPTSRLFLTNSAVSFINFWVWKCCLCAVIRFAICEDLVPMCVFAGFVRVRRDACITFVDGVKYRRQTALKS